MIFRNVQNSVVCVFGGFLAVSQVSEPYRKVREVQTLQVLLELLEAGVSDFFDNISVIEFDGRAPLPITIHVTFPHKFVMDNTPR